MSSPNITRRGYTLIELMVVVAVIGVLSAIGYAGYRRYSEGAKANEVHDIVLAIHAGQAAYLKAGDGYLDCSASLDSWYPAAPDGHKRAFQNPGHGDYECYKVLNIDTNAPTRMGYSVVAGVAGEAPPMTGLDEQPQWPNPTPDVWYVIQAAGDQNGDGNFSYFVSSSFAPNELLTTNEGE